MAAANPGPWVNPEDQDEEPWKTHGGIVKFIEFPVPLPGMSPRAFHLYWQKHHSPNVMNLTPFSQFMRKYLSAHKYPGEPVKLPAHYESAGLFEGAAEVWLNSVDEVVDWFSNPLYAEIIQPDERRFISQAGDVAIILTKEERILSADPDLAENLMTKVYLLARKKPDWEYDRFHAAASAHAREILASAALRSKVRRAAVSHRLREPLPFEGFVMSDIDAVFEFWFDDVEQARAFFSSPAYEAVGVRREPQLFAQVRALVARLRVVHDEFSFQPSTTQPLPFSWE